MSCILFFIAHLLIFNKKTRNFGANYRTDTELSRTIETGCHKFFFLIHFSILETYNKCRSNKLSKRF